jgi:nicotinamide riboside kinase
MKILVTGSFCSGKSTLAKDLKRRLPDAILIPELPRELLDVFGKINWGISELRDYLIVRQLFVEKKIAKKDKITIVDSGVISNIAHDLVLSENTRDRNPILKALRHDKYDLVFVCHHEEIKMIDDGQRFTSLRLREKIHQQVLEVLQKYNYKSFNLLQGNRLNRIKQAMTIINRHKTINK